MIPAATLLAPAARERVEALAAEIDHARREHARAGARAARVPLADRSLDHDGLARATRAVADVLRRHGALSDAEAAALDARPDLAGDVHALLAWASGRRADPPFAGAAVAWSVMRLALPAFVGTAEREEDDEAGPGSCPGCGMAPDLAVISPSGVRRLICGACDTEWRTDRIRCPFCGNASQDALAYLVGGAPGLLIRVCDRCHAYLKTIDRRALHGDETPLRLRLVLAEMDAKAADAGYHPGSAAP
ncbi:MAG TPA: formate dehydrogenase accessory protein FdhE [Candidatus Limnocylindria bacterium]|nr:formate dehydrogenase accessory protein FdhE [Candidatus Limnocylindria bacterium]